MNKQPFILALGTAMVLASGLYGPVANAQITEPVGARPRAASSPAR